MAKRSYAQTKALAKARIKAAQQLNYLKEVNSAINKPELQIAINTLQRSIRSKGGNPVEAMRQTKSIETINLLGTINSELTIRDLNYRIAYAKQQGETGPVNTSMNNKQISLLIKKFNDLYKAGLIKETFSILDYDSSRVGEFAKTVLAPEVLADIEQEAKKYVTPTFKDKYGWQDDIIDF